MTFQDDYPRICADVATKLYDLLVSLGLTSEIAEFAAREAGEVIRLDWGGEAIYIAKGRRYSVGNRDVEISAKFRGDNVVELAREYGLTTRMIHHILRRSRPPKQGG